MSEMNGEERLAAERVLELLPEFEAPSFVPATWPERFYIDKDGKRILNLPYPDYHPAVESLRDRLGAFIADIHPYQALPEDSPPGDVEFSPFGCSFPIEYFQTATVDQIRRYFVLLNRGERFSDGHIDGEFRAGKVVAALKRLSELVDKS